MGGSPLQKSMENNADFVNPILNHLHDDTDVQYSPEQHVDYFSHDWDETEISKSWRYVILKRNDFADSARLENASWRSWAQAKNGLKTISPEELNWSKDTDVTWLYGPIFKDEKHDDLDLKIYRQSQQQREHHHKQQQKLKKEQRQSHNHHHQHQLQDDELLDDENHHTHHHRRHSLQRDSSGSSLSYMDEDMDVEDADDEDENENGKGEHLKPILKWRSNVEKLISEASYSRLQNLFDKTDHKFKGSPILEATDNKWVSTPPEMQQSSAATENSNAIDKSYDAATGKER
ncbi:unnamed protein product [Ambrosiozyma monospora]|uniref:Unnamed protein product n=1 Tax=Ambrosiozyma monospora TaxID=43982 RepID=A0ACB5TP22_AMBMO|nr:unnamed protein product [Ambrosiozyma monospora]